LHIEKYKGLKIWVKNCPYCGSHHTQKKGTYKGRQRYRCIVCGRQFQRRQNKKRREKQLWKEYIYQRQTIAHLAVKYGRSKNWVRARIGSSEAARCVSCPQPVVLVADTTFFKKDFGICVFRSPHLKKNLYAQEVPYELIDAYRQGRAALENEGYSIQAIVLDGRPGVRQLFPDIPVQMCHFHQKQIVTRYLTNNLKHQAGIELKKLTTMLCTTE